MVVRVTDTGKNYHKFKEVYDKFEEDNERLFDTYIDPTDFIDSEDDEKDSNWKNKLAGSFLGWNLYVNLLAHYDK